MDGRAWEDKRVDQSVRENILSKTPDYVVNYYEWLVSKNMLPKTRRCYMRVVRRYLKWINPDIAKIDISVSSEKAITYLSYSSVTDDGSPVAISTRRTTYYALKSFYQYLVLAGLVGKNMLESPPSGRENIHRDRITFEQLQDVVMSVDNGIGTGRQKAYNAPWMSRDRALIALLCATGIRESALCNIDIDNIDFANKTLNYIDKGAKVHSVIIKTVIPEIREWLADRKALIQGYELSDHDKNALFITNRRRRISPNTVANITKRYSEEILGIKLAPHKIRGAYINTLYEDTHDIEFVRDVVNHSCISTTSRYLPDNPQNKLKAAEIIEGKTRKRYA